MGELILPDTEYLSDEKQNALERFSGILFEDPSSVVRAIDRTLNGETIQPADPDYSVHSAVDDLIESGVDIKISADDATETRSMEKYAEFSTRKSKRLARLAIFADVIVETKIAEDEAARDTQNHPETVVETLKPTAKPHPPARQRRKKSSKVA